MFRSLSRRLSVVCIRLRPRRFSITSTGSWSLPRVTTCRQQHTTVNPWDFKGGLSDAEEIARYESGGYHPVQLGDLFKSGRYKIVHKLGWGGFSTTWLARGQVGEQHVALKICVSAQKDSNYEVSVLQTMASSLRGHPGQKHVVQLHDSFEVDGPNGRNTCIVMEPLAHTMSHWFDNDNRNILPAFAIKATARQMLLALDGLHEHGFVYGGAYSLMSYDRSRAL